jgi:transgelin
LLTIHIRLHRLYNKMNADKPQLKFSTSKMPFAQVCCGIYLYAILNDCSYTCYCGQMENINTFLTAISAMGVPKFEQFQTIDLYEGKNLKAVVDCLFSVSRNAAKHGYEGPTLGPKLADKRSISFTQEQLNEAKNTIPMQAGFTGGANASGVNFGKSREIISKPPGQ